MDGKQKQIGIPECDWERGVPALLMPYCHGRFCANMFFLILAEFNSPDDEVLVEHKLANIPSHDCLISSPGFGTANPRSLPAFSQSAASYSQSLGRETSTAPAVNPGKSLACSWYNTSSAQKFPDTAPRGY